ncbi:MAG TPA: DNA primase [Candidatus Saccharimonadales bacterium]|nr:DNA primase [Candidatus Saccharimonadales bacterium]
MANPGDFAYTVKQQADIVRIIGEYVKLRKAGAQNYSGLCPFHGEKTPSFSVHASRQYFHCFGCGVSGDVFTFVQKIENVTFPEAVRAIAQKLGIAAPKAQFNSPQEAKEARTRGLLLDLHEAACLWFQEQLRRPEAAAAREYLHGRGLDDEAIARFRIGFAPESGFLLRDKLKGLADEDALRESGLFSWKEKDDTRGEPSRPAPAALYSKFRNRIMFPICNESGKVIAFTARTLATDDKSGPKYLNSPETPIYSKSRVLFNLHLAKEAIRRLDYIILVEGQMDCISVFNAGYHNVIASSGTAFTEPQARLLARFSKKIVVNFDPDTAGAAAAERSLSLLVSEDFEIRIVTLEQGYDPDLYVRRKGAPAYGLALQGSQKYFDYLIERAQAQFPRTAEGKVKAVNYLLPHIQRIPSRIVRDELAADVSQKLQIDSAVLRQELRHVAGARTSTKLAPRPEASLTEAERLLLQALTSGSELAFAFLDENGQEQVYNPAEQAYYTLSSEQLHKGLRAEAVIDAVLKGLAEGTDLMTLPLSDEDRTLFMSVLMKDHEQLTAELLHGAIESLRVRRLKHRQRELVQQTVEAARNNDYATVARLNKEKQEVDSALRLAKTV